MSLGMLEEVPMNDLTPDVTVYVAALEGNRPGKWLPLGANRGGTEVMRKRNGAVETHHAKSGRWAETIHF
ncbi:hypothetical protein RvY_08713 [Ramazzottius varieornatus]|uniref:Uncharacterized protein n=1 Tax=Ramazzottius varieornatus TaxID=947166 RepID=A0A1D1VCD9_RAMVA|nr:hypothetical protein RvY_08713 [Ramazzottius varieornatus]